MHTGKIPGSNKKGANPAHNANPQTYTDTTRGKSSRMAFPAQGSAAPQPPPSAQIGLSAKLPKGRGK